MAAMTGAQLDRDLKTVKRKLKSVLKTAKKVKFKKPDVKCTSEKLREGNPVRLAIHIEESRQDWVLLNDDASVVAIRNGDVQLCFGADYDFDPMVRLENFEWHDDFGWILVLVPKKVK